MAALAAALPLLFVCCSVKEDRDDCPCLLTIDSGQAVEGSMVLNIVHSVQGVVSQGETTIGTAVYEVPRGIVGVYAYCNGDGWTISSDGTAVSLSEGSEPGYIYAHSNLVDCYGEQASDTVSMRKQWCTITILTEAPEETAGSVVEGKWNGFSLTDFSATPGDFSCPLRQISEHFMEVRVTRQGDNSLVLSTGNGQTYAIGEAIEEAGYDWTRSSLDDINLSLSDVCVEVEIVPIDWEDGLDDKNPTI